MIKGVLAVVSFVVFFLTAQAQPNLVRNGDFSLLHTCPSAHNVGRTKRLVPGWTSPSRGTPDVFHTCSQLEAGVPSNWAGMAEPKVGSGYVGIYVWWERPREYREYIQAELTDIMLEGQRYQIEFYVRLASYCRFAIDRVGFALVNEPENWMSDSRYTDGPYQQVIFPDALTVHSEAWHKVSFEITAQGGEQFLIIGNFDTNSATHSHRLTHRTRVHRMLEQSAYYFIDDVRVTRITGPDWLLAEELFGEWPQPEKAYSFPNILFEFDKAILRPESYILLDKLVRWMEEHPGPVEIEGHTDDMGTEAYNLDLSQRRADAVAAYFVQKGVAPTEIHPIGFGKSRPLIPGSSEEARQQNRRVEIRFLNP
jgi:OmpA-OmpF porin, OOP family